MYSSYNMEKNLISDSKFRWVHRLIQIFSYLKICQCIFYLSIVRFLNYTIAH